MLLSILAIAMFVVAVVFSMLGLGGGIRYTPIQVWGGIAFPVAATPSLVLILVVSLASSVVFPWATRMDWVVCVVVSRCASVVSRKAKEVAGALVLGLETIKTLGGFAGGLWSGQFSGKALSLLFAVLVAVAAYFMVRTFDVDRSCEKDGKGFFLWRRRLDEQTYCVNLVIALPVSFVAGLASGMVGVGGGILKVPMMVLLFGVPMDIAVGCSALMVGITAAGGFAGHVAVGHWDWRASLVLAVVVFLGGQIGSRISIGLDKKELKKGFGWFLLLIAVMMFARLCVGA